MDKVGASPCPATMRQTVVLSCKPQPTMLVLFLADVPCVEWAAHRNNLMQRFMMPQPVPSHSLFLLLLLAAAQCSTALAQDSPLPPDEAARRMTVPEGFHV